LPVDVTSPPHLALEDVISVTDLVVTVNFPFDELLSDLLQLANMIIVVMTIARIAFDDLICFIFMTCSF
jgi:hypothetical protein